jgi:hypothetical protein
MKNVIFIITMFAVVGCYDSTDLDTDTVESDIDTATEFEDTEAGSETTAGDVGIELDGGVDSDIEQVWEMPCKHNMCYCDISDPNHKAFRCCIEGDNGWYWGHYICTQASVCVWSGSAHDSSGCATLSS